MRRRTPALLVGGCLVATVLAFSASAAPDARDRSGGLAGDSSPITSVNPGVTTGRADPGSLTDTANYWTLERMQSAKPVERTVPGGTSSPPATTPKTATATEPSAKTATRPAPRKPAKRLSSSADSPSGVTSGTSTSNTGYWTEDRMRDAQPKDMTVPGGEADAGSSDPGVGVVSATP
jgi:hypothetical protein